MAGHGQALLGDQLLQLIQPVNLTAHRHQQRPLMLAQLKLGLHAAPQPPRGRP
jgi:hypothetical protein